jgi:hypothetical protein
MRALVAVSLVVVGCVHPAIRQPRLASALTLEAQLDSVRLRHGETIRARFLLTNVSAAPVEFCMLDGGVTTAIVLDGTPVPLKGYGAGSDVGCSRVRLLAHEAREYVEEFPVWPCPAAGDFIGSIRLYTPTGHDEADVRSVPLPVTISDSDHELPGRCTQPDSKR